MKKRFNKKSILLLLIILITIMSSLFVAYSSLSKNLSISNGKTIQNAIAWDVGFVTGSVNGIGLTGNETCGEAIVSLNEVSGIHVELTKPGDKCSYALTLKNAGSIDAELTNILSINPSDKECLISDKAFCLYSDESTNKIITSELIYDNDYLTLHDVIEKGTSKIIYFNIYYNDTATKANDDFEYNQIGFKLNFSQK